MRDSLSGFDVRGGRHLEKSMFGVRERLQPELLLTWSSKRHHSTFVQNPRDGDRSGNVPAGTVVDQGVTSTTDFDFLPQLHAGIQGTNKPAEYHVLVDENRFPADANTSTYHLCHVYAEMQGPVSIPAPTYSLIWP